GKEWGESKVGDAYGVGPLPPAASAPEDRRDVGSAAHRARRRRRSTPSAERLTSAIEAGSGAVVTAVQLLPMRISTISKLLGSTPLLRRMKLRIVFTCSVAPVESQK